MSAIWKYPLAVGGGPLNLLIPGYYRVLHVAEQGGQPCMWVLCNPGDPERSVTFAIIGTGHDFPICYTYRGSAHCGAFVWHVLEYEPF